MDQADVLIVGAGMGGLALAARLGELGYQVSVVEVVPEWQHVGSGLLLLGNAMRVLEVLSIDNAAREAGYQVDSVRYLNSKGKELFEIRPERDVPGWSPILGIHRARLHEVLLGANLQTKIRMGLTVESMEQTAESVEVTYSDGSEGSYSIVIGADGVSSKVRELTFGPGGAKPTGLVCSRIVLPTPPGMQGVDFHVGPGNSVGIIPIDNESSYFMRTFFDPDRSRNIVLDEAEEIRRECGHFGGRISEVLSNLESADQVQTRKLEQVVLPTWTQGRVGLLGDAAHALLPGSIQGAALALEDALAISSAISRHGATSNALDHFNRDRMPRATAIQSRTMQQARLLNGPKWLARFAIWSMGYVGGRVIRSGWGSLMNDFPKHVSTTKD